MSDPIRYAMSWATDEDEFVYVSPKEQANGNWVKWEDYARLKALTVEMDKTINISQAGCRELKAEVERMTKAGDAMAEIVNGTYCVTPPQALIGWNAAKEGKQP
jgi:hypothetical protein